MIVDVRIEPGDMGEADRLGERLNRAQRDKRYGDRRPRAAG